MQVHVQPSVAGYSAVLRQLRSIRRSVPSSVYQSLVVVIVLSRLDYGNVTLASLPASLLNRPHSVFNAAARSPPSLGAYCRCCHQFPLASSAERIKFKLAVIVHGTAPQYLSGQLQFVADLPSRRRGRLRSSTSSLLDVRPSRLVTVGDRSFAAAGPRLWSSLPVDVQPAPSLTSFRQKLKTHLFRQSYPDIVFSCFAIVVIEVTLTWSTLQFRM